MALLIKNAIHEDAATDVLIEGNRFSRIEPHIEHEGAEILDASGMAIMPTFVNAHTHASMSLLRSYADDLELHDWLANHIWPLEAQLTEDDIYHGARLACLEMIKSGTTCFNDMYWHFHGVARAVEEMGMRAMLSSVLIDLGNADQASQQRQLTIKLHEERQRYAGRIRFALGPHAIYSVSSDSLRWVKSFSEDNDLPIHIHLSETEKEVKDCLAIRGIRPVQWLDKIGFLGPDTIAAHVIHVTNEEIGILARNDVKVVHNPVSNMKLASGNFPFGRIKDAGIHISLGTDGCSSNNNLCMLEEMKIATLLAKTTHLDPTLLPAREVFDMATVRGAETLGFDCGVVAEGKLADCMLVDLDNPRLVPGYNLIDDLVYSADSSCIDTVVCDGKVLMRGGYVEGQEEIVAEARAYKKRFRN